MRIGFVGLGKMGAPMVRRLLGAGLETRVYDLNQGAADALTADGALPAGSAAEAAMGADLAICMLPDGDAVASAAPAMTEAMKDGAALADMSTSDPFGTRALRGRIRSGVHFIDAPVSGGVWRAEAGSLTIMAGGDPTVIAEVEPALSAMGTVTRCGDLASGHAMKLLNNYLSAAGLAAACEAVSIGRAFGLDPDLMADVFNGSTGRSNATEVKLKKHVNSEAYASGFSMGLMAKDLTLGRALMQQLGLSVEGLERMQSLYARGVGDLGPEADHTEIAKLLNGD
ncbi:MAG: NAD(P)-dependent oxidoreductase [Pseudomonadota bacterium]